MIYPIKVREIAVDVKRLDTTKRYRGLTALERPQGTASAEPPIRNVCPPRCRGTCR